jgi:hypothetical protein
MQWKRTLCGSGFIDPHIMTWSLVGGEWSASRPGRFIPWERAPVTHWILGWVCPSAVSMSWRGKKYFSYSLVLVAILTALSWLIHWGSGHSIINGYCRLCFCLRAAYCVGFHCFTTCFGLYGHLQVYRIFYFHMLEGFCFAAFFAFFSRGHTLRVSICVFSLFSFVASLRMCLSAYSKISIVLL